MQTKEKNFEADIEGIQKIRYIEYVTGKKEVEE